jgi:hypothetical protein
VEQRSDESAEAEVRDLDARMPTPSPADLGGGRIRPAALVRWGFFAGVGLLLAYGAAQALLSVRNLLVLVLVAMFLAVSLDPAVRWLTTRGLPRGLAVGLILLVLVAILAAFLISVIPHLVSQFTTLVHRRSCDPGPGRAQNKYGGAALASTTALASGSRSTGLDMTAWSSSGPLGNSSAAGHRCPDRARTAPPTFAQRPTSTGMGQLIVIGVRRPILPGSARPHLGSGAARWLGCAPDLAGPGRSLLGPQAVPASGERRPTQCSCTSGSGKAVVSDPWTVPPHRKRVNQTRPAAGSAAGAVGDATAVSEAGHETSGRPALWHPLLP